MHKPNNILELDVNEELDWDSVSIALGSSSSAAQVCCRTTIPHDSPEFITRTRTPSIANHT